MRDPLHPSLYQINTRVWMTELARSLGHAAEKLGGINRFISVADAVDGFQKQSKKAGGQYDQRSVSEQLQLQHRPEQSHPV